MSPKKLHLAGEAKQVVIMTHEDAGGGLKGPEKNSLNTHTHRRTHALMNVHPRSLNDSLVCTYRQCWKDGLESVVSQLVF